MAEFLKSIRERVDDIPVFLAQLERMGVPPLLDEPCPTHGNWVGLSLGWVTVIWLTPTLSEANHRLNHVAPWAEQRLQTLRGASRQRVHPLDVSDDRLAAVLEALSDDTRWQAFEGALTQHLLRVYDLQPQRVRLDSTTASGSWAVTEDGLCQLGHRKDHRPDLPQVKVRLSVLAPLGLPVATAVVPGQRADDPLDLPAVTRVRESLGPRGLLYVGDGQMRAREPRATLHAGGDFYLGPWSALQVPPAVVATSLASVWTGEPPLPPVRRGQANGAPAVTAEGVARLEALTAVVAGGPLHWTERRLGIRSHQRAQAGERGLHARLAEAPAAVAALNGRGRGKPRFTELPALQAAVEALLTRERVQGWPHVRYTAQERWQAVRRYGDRTPRLRLEGDWQATPSVDEEVGGAARRQVGWRVYATNAPPAQLSLAQAVLAYRRQYLLEHAIGRLKGHPLSVSPMDLQQDDHVSGLSRLLSAGLRVLTLLELVVRQRLATAGTALAGVYAGTPKRATARPTTERLLKGFEGLPLPIIREGRRRRYHLTPRSRMQRPMLALLNFSVDIYTRLCPDSHKPP